MSDKTIGDAMSAERLREAARVMREMAGAATPGPWGDPAEVHYGDYGWSVYGCPAGETEDSEQGRADAAYIAAIHPSVALAVADLLDEVADTGPMSRAVAVTDAFFGTSSGTS